MVRKINPGPTWYSLGDKLSGNAPPFDNTDGFNLQFSTWESYSKLN